LLAQSGCYSLCLASSAGNGASSQFQVSIPGISVDPGVPASISIIGSTPYGQLPYVSAYSYQINNQFGAPVTGSAYYAAELATGPAYNTNGQYLSAPNGVIKDYVGLTVTAVPPDYYGTSTTQTQTYSALYDGYFYAIPTVLQHNISVSSSGNVSISVTIISP
jgi:hypothetical protein